MDKEAVIFFIKYAEPGRVKTRLGSRIGLKRASELYRCFVMDILSLLRSLNKDVLIFYVPDTSLEKVRGWLGTKMRYFPQKEGADLGERMAVSLESAFKLGYEKSIIIGGDLPDLSSDIILQAFKDLNDHQSVIGPSDDGGYYLIGFNKKDYLNKVFQGIRWSTPEVFKMTMRIFNKEKYSVSLLQKWHDIDTLEDLRNLYNNNRNKDRNGSYTMKYLDQIASDLF
ncbi:MAG: TIGR04282 family arsenosugar biosynthesis glycosyltransferase [Spirochaetes bacterium]|nr:TIGR04282 family arsenosugar biosynthesis glycosyltransferase [Spirochaetota bacterium]